MPNTGAQPDRRALNRKYLLLLLIGLAVLAAVAVTVILLQPKDTAGESPTVPQVIDSQGVNVKAPLTDSLKIDGFTDIEANFTVPTANGWRLDRFGCYNGVFIEQGRDRERELPATLCLVLTNTSPDMVDYAELTLQTGSGEAVFAVTNLPAGQTVLVQEQNGLQYDSAAVYTAMDDSVCTRSGGKTLLEGSLRVSGMDGVLNIENLTGQTLADVQLYYKSVISGIYFGGITYRLSSGSIFEDRAAQCKDEGYSYDEDELLYAVIDYE